MSNRRLVVSSGIAVAVAVALAYGFYSSPGESAGTLSRNDRPGINVSPASRDPVAVTSIRVAFLGDSIARGTGDETGRGFDGILHQELQRYGIALSQSFNLGLDGARTTHVLEQLRGDRVRQLIGKADVIIVSIGANDLFVDSHARRATTGDAEAVAGHVLQRLDQIVAQLRELNGESRLFLLGLYNPFFDSSFGPLASSYVQQWNAKLRSRYADQPGIQVIQTFDLLDRAHHLSFDHFHPSAEGYRRIARRVAERL